MADEPNEDLSMDDILSSIRNILTEDNAAQKSAGEQTVQQSVPEILPEDVSPAVFNAVPEDVVPSEIPVLSEVPSDVSLPEADEEVFELSASMMIDEQPSEQPAELNITDEPEISEADILNFSNLAAGAAADVEMPAEMPLAVEENIEPEPVPVFEPSVPPMPIQAPLASEVLAEEEPEISLDDITDLSGLIEQPENETVSGEEVPAAIPPLDFDLPQIDVDADPIFEPESMASPEMDPSQVMESLTSAEEILPQEIAAEENVIDDDTLNEILDFHAQVEEAKQVVSEPEEIFVAAEEPELQAEPTDNIQDVIAEPVTEVLAAEPEISATPQDSADISANIINNFAKLFAEKKAAEAVVEPVAETKPEIVKTASPSISELVREAVVKQVTQQMDVNFESYAREAVAAQTQAWLDANLPAIVEAVVSKEIERVMAKVGS